MVPVLRGDLASFDRIKPGGFRILWALDEAVTLLYQDLTITCGTEDHPPDDPHTRGEAYDVRVRDLQPEQVVKLVIALRSKLGPLFTVLLETPHAFTNPQLVALQTLNPHATAPHVHVQVRQDASYPQLEGSLA